MNIDLINNWRMRGIVAMLLFASMLPLALATPAGAGPTGSVVVTGDNAVEVFVNGVSVGSSDNWKAASTVLAELAVGDVVAVHATDAGAGIGAMIAEVSWDANTAVSGTSWKVSTTPETDWETKGFDDAAWDQATTYGTYGIAPWGTNVAGFPTDSTADWIWSADNDADNDIYLRYTIATPVPPPNGSVVVTGDNAVEVFVNGVSVGSSDNWKAASTVLAELAVGDVVAVHATDAGAGIGAMIAEVSWDANTAVSGTSWKVSTTPETDWETKGFDDAAWDQATTYGTYGIAPWGTNVAGFPTDSTADWIWSADNDADNDIYLRYTIATPVPPPNGSVVVTGDNAVEVFVNGDSVGSSDDWRKATTILAELAIGDVVAVHATDAGGIGAMIAEVSWDANTAVSGTSWKVSTTPETDWETKGFDDAAWDAATAHGAYGIAPWGTNVAGFPTDSTANWIWSADSDADNDIYLRYTVATP